MEGMKADVSKVTRPIIFLQANKLKKCKRGEISETTKHTVYRAKLEHSKKQIADTRF